MGQAVRGRKVKRWRWGVPHVDYCAADRHGHARWWYRRGKEPRGPALPMWGTAEFLPAWQAAHAAAEAGARLPVLASARTKPGSLSAALVAYYGSSVWTDDLAQGSRDLRRGVLEKLRNEFGDAPLKKLTREHVQALLRRQSSPNVQRNWKLALNGFLKFAVSENLIATNPADGVVRAKALPSDGYTAWTEDDVDKFRAYWQLGTRQRLALEIMLNLGLRRSDCCLIGPDHVKAGWLIDFVPKKTARTSAVKISVPLHDDLKAAIAAMKTVSTNAYLLTERGHPFKTEESFGAFMREAYSAAGLPDVASHGLRKLAAIRLAFSGAGVFELMKIFGWKKIAQAQVYVDQADQMRMSAQAFARLEAYQKANKVSPTL